jgi:hypothetical protein
MVPSIRYRGAGAVGGLEPVEGSLSYYTLIEADLYLWPSSSNTWCGLGGGVVYHGVKAQKKHNDKC